MNATASGVEICIGTRQGAAERYRAGRRERTAERMTSLLATRFRRHARRVFAAAAITLGMLFVPAMGFAADFDNQYEALVGDYDSNGRIDIYLRRRPTIVIVNVDDIPTPIVTSKREIGEFLLLQNANGEFALQTNLSANDLSALGQWQPSTVKTSLADFNMDGNLDLVVGNVATAINQPAIDTIVYARQQVGLAPQQVRAMNAQFTQFFADVKGVFANPNYYQSGMRKNCTYILVPWYFPSGVYEGLYYPFDIPLLYCYQYYDPSGFHPLSEQFFALVTSVINDGYVQHGSTKAQQLADILEAILGTEVMNGVLRNGGYGDFTGHFPKYGLNFEQSDGFLGPPSVDVYRLIRVLLWFEFIVDDPDEPGVEHTYSHDSGICVTSNPDCTIASVMGEIRYHPTPGYMWNMKQVVDDQILDHVEVDASLPGDRAGPVRVKVNPPGYPPNSIVNKTEPGHRFHPGEVVRTVYEVNGEIRIHTFGSGTGANPELNSAVGPIVYEQVDHLIACHLNQGQPYASACRPLHNRVPAIPPYPGP